MKAVILIFKYALSQKIQQETKMTDWLINCSKLLEIKPRAMLVFIPFFCDQINCKKKTILEAHKNSLSGTGLFYSLRSNKEII